MELEDSPTWSFSFEGAQTRRWNCSRRQTMLKNKIINPLNQARTGNAKQKPKSIFESEHNVVKTTTQDDDAIFYASRSWGICKTPVEGFQLSLLAIFTSENRDNPFYVVRCSILMLRSTILLLFSDTQI